MTTQFLFAKLISVRDNVGQAFTSFGIQEFETLKNIAAGYEAKSARLN